MLRLLACLAALALGPALIGPAAAQEADARPPAQAPAKLRPVARTEALPRTRWERKRGSDLWTRGALAALKTHGKPLVNTVPQDIDAWCPAYKQADEKGRRAFWVGLLSALAKHESTYRPQAVGGGGKWFGLVQIYPPTARGYGCAARSGEALKKGVANLSCAIRIMSVTVPRDRAIAVRRDRWRGVAADWGPMTSKAKRRDMAGWLRKQPYCIGLDQLRPRARPVKLVQAE